MTSWPSLPARLLSLLVAIPVAAQTVTDGDTIKFGTTIYRLWGIDAPETKQVCADGWPAGSEATRALEIEAQASEGFAESDVGVVRDNAKQLKFKAGSTGFED